MKRMVNGCILTVFTVLAMMIQNVFSQQQDSLKTESVQTSSSKKDISTQVKDESVKKEITEDIAQEQNNEKNNSNDTLIRKTEKNEKSDDKEKEVRSIHREENDKYKKTSQNGELDPESTDTLLSDKNGNNVENNHNVNNDSSKARTTDTTVTDNTSSNKNAADGNNENTEKEEETASLKTDISETPIVETIKNDEKMKNDTVKSDMTGVEKTIEDKKQIDTAANETKKENDFDSLKIATFSESDSAESNSRFMIKKDINSFISDSGILRMELKDVLDFTITYNPRILNARADWLGKCRQQPATWAVFEPDFVTEYSGGLSEQLGSRYPEQKNKVKVGVEGKFISGAQYNIGFSDNEIFHSAYTMEIPKAFSGITVTQPLLRDAWFGAPLTEIKIAKIDMNISFHSYRSELMSTLYNVENAYWKLSFAQEKVRFAEESEEIAEKLLNDSRARNAAGKMSKMGLVEAEAELAYRTALRTDAQRELEEAANQLKITMSNNDIPSWMKMKTSSPLYLNNNDTVETINDSITKETIQYQPEYCINQYQSSREKIVVNYQSNQCLPTVNLTGSYGYYAYGRDGHSAMANFQRQGFLSWTAGIEARVPLIFGMKERSDLIAARLKSRAVSDNVISKEYELLNSLILINNRIAALKNRIDNARTVVDAREKQLAVEMGAINAGKSNFRRAFEIEEDLDEAKQWQLESHMLYRQSLLQWELIKGTLLQKKGYEKVEEERPVLIEHLSGPYKYLLWFLLSEEETK